MHNAQFLQEFDVLHSFLDQKVFFHANLQDYRGFNSLTINISAVLSLYWPFCHPTTYVSVVVRHRDEVLAGADAELVHAANHRINIISAVSAWLLGTLTAGHK